MMSKMRQTKLPVDTNKEPSIFVDPGESMPIITGYTDQITNFVEKYVRPTQGRTDKTVGQRVYDLWYDLSFELGQHTAGGEYIDFLAAGYLVAPIVKFVDNVINYKPEDSINSWYSEKKKAIKANIAGDIEYELSILNKMGDLNKIKSAPSQYDTYMNTMGKQLEKRKLETELIETEIKYKWNSDRLDRLNNP